jgi:hypothetical protein
LFLVMLCPGLAWAQTSLSPAIQPTTDAMLAELRKLVMDQRAILLNAISLFRQAQIRYTHRLREQLQLALALEYPSGDHRPPAPW